ncbi:LacI family DNA-binding transcriptional regulator [Paenibacillus filicis]|uniref:LacI family DNA-binding transcriptional regulator n=1 Tax=Paenibacillus filicis TaxID=669464 RepID=A0ABU9DFK3_9BACL
MTPTPKKRVTIKSIAEEMGISFSTVSKALNGDPLVNKETVKRVLQKAEELNYSPNLLARGLRSKGTKTIGIILNDLENQAHTNIVRRISIDLAKHDYTTLLCDSQFDLSMERKNIKTVLSRMPDSIMISPVSSRSDNLSLLSHMWDRTIVLDYISNSIDTNYVNVNHARSGYLSAAALLSRGHLHNLVLAGPVDFPASTSYIQGIKQAYNEYGLPFQEEMIVHGVPSIEEGYKSILEKYAAQQTDQSFTGVIAFCDTLAFGVYKAAAKLNLRIPEDISVIGYDDNPLSSFSSPPLTSVHFPRERVAAHCSDILIEKLVHQEDRLRFYSLEPHLMERGSVQQPNDAPFQPFARSRQSPINSTKLPRKP